MLRRILCLALMLSGGRAFAWNSPAPDVVLYCPPALQNALHRVADGYTAASGVNVHVFVAPPDGLKGLIAHRARDDVVVADSATIAALAARNQVQPESVVRLGKDPFVLIRNDRAALPPGAGVAQLVATYPTVLPDPTTAASFDGAAVLRADGRAASPVQEIGVSDTPTVIARVREETGLLGLVHQTEASGPGIAKAATLAVAATEVSAGLVTNGQSANAATFLGYLAGPKGAAVLHAFELEPES